MRLSFAFALLLSAACATANPHYGQIAFKSGANAASRPAAYSVDKGRLSSSDFDARLEGDCIRGVMGSIPLQFCREGKPGPVEHWAGASGAFTVKNLGNAVDVDGYMTVRPGRQVYMTQTIPLGEGPQWEEMKRNPALLAVAATAADLKAVHGSAGF
jgi:hypothetical protein